ncbi:elongation factor Ts, mitochondrial [Cuculus canorus]|uniref:elongation factor Ts, mitochondrial n=1 Tax=Cuculus canorus TaxID=55661 RepID=UPI0023AB1CA0|nr:elongation factor Ts, mitochondrial [Cuculus canorus]
MQRAVLGAAWGAARAPPCRWFRGAPPARALDKAALLELRRRTGLPVLQCRAALERCGGALQQAEAWLQEEARRLGCLRAAESGGSEGLVGLFREGSAAVMVEINCETDFVARTADFGRVVERAALSTMAMCRAAPPGCSRHLLSEEELSQLRTEEGEMLSDHIAVATTKLGERVALRRAAWLRVPRRRGLIGAYAHGRTAAAAPSPVATGTYGALVALVTPEGGGGGGGDVGVTAAAQLEELGRRVAQHVVGLAPSALGREGEAPRGDDEPRLLAQSFLLAPEMAVGQILRRSGAKAVDFVRFRCGDRHEVIAPGDVEPEVGEEDGRTDGAEGR